MGMRKLLGHGVPGREPELEPEPESESDLESEGNLTQYLHAAYPVYSPVQNCVFPYGFE